MSPGDAAGPPRFIVVLKLPENEVPKLVLQARGIVEGMTGNAWFPSPSPSLTVVQAAIDALDVAEVATLTGTKGLATARDEKRRDLVVLLQYLAVYVGTVVSANPEHAESIAASARMFLKKAGGRTAQVLSAEQGDHSGELRAFGPPAGDRAIHEFDYSVDGGITRISTGADTKASTTIRGLKPGTTVLIRHRVKVKGVFSNWSDPIEIIVG